METRVSGDSQDGTRVSACLPKANQDITETWPDHGRDMKSVGHSAVRVHSADSDLAILFRQGLVRHGLARTCWFRPAAASAGMVQ
jgi:hypothetical protein